MSHPGCSGGIFLAMKRAQETPTRPVSISSVIRRLAMVVMQTGGQIRIQMSNQVRHSANLILFLRMKSFQKRGHPRGIASKGAVVQFAFQYFPKWNLEFIH